MEILNIKNIVEDNGKTVEHNNIKKNHNIPIGALVEVKYNQWLGDGCCVKVHARLWVVGHGRDCDGTPLYTLSPFKVNIFPKGRIIFDSQSVLMGEVELNSDICKSILNKYESGFKEEDLTVIEVTQDIKNGKNSLTWEKGE